MGGILDNINQNVLDPDLQKIIALIDERKRGWMSQVVAIVNNLHDTLSAEEFDHAMSDIEFTFERRMLKKP